MEWKYKSHVYKTEPFAKAFWIPSEFDADMKGLNIQEGLDLMGSTGWELAGVTLEYSNVSGKDYRVETFYFKKPVDQIVS